MQLFYLGLCQLKGQKGNQAVKCGAASCQIRALNPFVCFCLLSLKAFLLYADMLGAQFFGNLYYRNEIRRDVTFPFIESL